MTVASKIVEKHISADIAERWQETMGKLAENVSFRMGDVIIVFNHDIVGEGISAATKKLYPDMLFDKTYPCHTEFVESPDKNPVRVFSAEVWGLWYRDLKRNFKETARVLLIRDDRLTIENRFEMQRIMRKMKGTRYNYGGFFWFIFKRIPILNKIIGNVDTGRMCAENVAGIYKKIGRRMSTVRPKSTAPCHILRYAMDMKCEITELWVGDKF